MTNKNQVLTFDQIENFSPAKTAEWLHAYLVQGEGDPYLRIDNFLLYIRLIKLMYGFTGTKMIDPLDYKQTVIAIYMSRSWTEVMARSFADLQFLFEPQEKIAAFEKFYVETKESLLKQMPADDPRINTFESFAAQLREEATEGSDSDQVSEDRGELEAGEASWMGSGSLAPMHAGLNGAEVVARPRVRLVDRGGRRGLVGSDVVGRGNDRVRLVRGSP